MEKEVFDGLIKKVLRKRAFFGLFSDHGWLDSWIVREKSDGENDFEKKFLKKNVSVELFLMIYIFLLSISF